MVESLETLKVLRGAEMKLFRNPCAVMCAVMCAGSPLS
jgi:hypothetical protein